MTTQRHLPKSGLDALLTPEERPGADRPPAVPVRQSEQPRTHDDRQQRHRPGQDRQGLRRADDPDHGDSRNVAATSSRVSRTSSRIRSRSTAPSSTPGKTRVVDAVKKTGRKKLILAALWTEICLAMPAIQALGRRVRRLRRHRRIGGVSAEAHDMASVAWRAGVVPITWMAVAGECSATGLARRRPKRGPDLLEHGGGTGIALAWELQLLNQKSGIGA